MDIVWDEHKRRANIEKHGLDFADLSLTFFLNAWMRPAKLGRIQAVGKLDDGSISVIFMTLGSQGLSVISMRPANVKERSLIR
ncbi:hypothetical protein HFC70_03240 [Agrobacterium sp. a22-2]|uniref:BrnT family toxin n=1 Tax=Agrobacterium sp. a22-2 TaxID=2283840 RepID=UPI001446BFDA|nr:BrnT family toxin [Agrobacterium sp. a22-2]NKN35362.1 hypothetical protein [Agrobacterium sp. a22-2]